MKLSVKDRILFPSLYPQKGSLVEQLLIKDIDSKVSLKQKEITEIKLRDENGKITWEDKKAKVLDVSFTAPEVDFLKSQVDRLDSAKEITRDIIDLCTLIKG